MSNPFLEKFYDEVGDEFKARRLIGYLADSGIFTQPGPRTLNTLEDHENAPAGTIVVDEDGWPCVKDAAGRWFKPGAQNCCNYYYMSGTSEVMRWGWDKYDTAKEAHKP